MANPSRVSNRTEPPPESGSAVVESSGEPFIETSIELVPRLSFEPRRMPAARQLAILQVTDVRRQVVACEPAWMRVGVAMKHQNRTLDRREHRRIHTVGLQTNHVTPRFCMRHGIDRRDV